MFNRWVFAAGFLFACILLFLLAGAAIFLRSGNNPGIPATAVIQKISAPTVSINMTLEPVTSTESATEGIIPAPQGGEIAVGVYVKVVGTGGDGLRLRDAPGLDGEVRMLGEETEVFIVNEGPLEIDGYKWWYLTGKYDQSHQGWAVSDFLTVVENP